MKERIYKVYHIRLKGNTNLNEGYIGITKNSLKFRLLQHTTSKRPIGTVLRSLQPDEYEIVELFRGNKQFALDKEYELRPQRNIGWNVMAGGDRATVVCPICGKHLPKRATGSKCMECHNTKFQKGHVPHNYGCGEKYELTDPDGNKYIPEAFTVFCREHGLTPQNLRKVAKGLRKHSNGWTAKKVG